LRRSQFWPGQRIIADMAGGAWLSELESTACELARAGGALARQRLGTATASRKADRTLVTDVDHAVQDLILETLGRRFPTHAVVAEETLRRPDRHAALGEAEFCWIVDPLDGTRNYLRGFPGFATSIAVARAGVPVVAAVYGPMTDQLYRAASGLGAWLGERRLGVRNEGSGRDTLLAVPSGRSRPLPRAVVRWLDKLVLRNIGSTALHLALVAAGALDAAFSHECGVWDVAAGWLLVCEAGGVVTDLAGQPLFPRNLADRAGDDVQFLAAGPRLHAELLGALSQA